MSQYTELLIAKAETLFSDDDGYEESLLEISTLFRGFGEALTAFVEEHGYTGDSADVSAKTRFLREKFKTANVEPPHSFKEWFVLNKQPKRDIAYRICFALGLNVDETNDFFRRVQFERGFNCHIISEAVYYFCLKNGLSYSEAQDIINQIPETQKVKAIPNGEVLYTSTIIEYINGIDNKERLIQYITDHIDDFRYNNVTAIKYIQELWADISKADGLAVKEGSIIDRTRNRKDVDDCFKGDRYVVADSNASTWTIFSQIIGLQNDMKSKYAAKHDRRLHFILSENALLPLKASYCFPGQHSIDRLLRGELADNEMIRKMLIFLTFYTYWAKIVIDKNGVCYSAKRSDSERCLATINGRLLDAGYPESYAGNPYDWIFMWALNDEYPLDAFRTYMGEVFAVKAEQEDTGE